MPKMDETTLVAILAAEKADALSADQAAKLSDERERNMDYYNGDLSEDMPSLPDRSKAVSSDVLDTVEGLMPSLMEIFCGGDEVVKFSPVGPEDEPLAEQETDYINHVFMQENDGFLITYSFVKDALLSKNGFVKIHWEEKEEGERETFLDQPDDVYALLAADPDIEIIAHTEKMGEAEPPETPVEAPPAGMEAGPGMMGAPSGAMPPAMPLPPPTLHDITVSYKRSIKRCRIDPTPPEEISISRHGKLGQPLDYSCHRVRRTQAELIRMGYDKEQVKSLPDASKNQNEEETARDTVDEDNIGNSSAVNEATRLVDVTEHYAMLDYEGDGEARLYRVTTAGSGNGQVLKRDGEPDIEQIDFDPWASTTPCIVTHRFYGKAIADLVVDIMRIKTSLLRGMLDNVYLANNQRIEIAESHAGKDTIDDLLNNRPGGIVRTKQPGGMMPIPNQNLGEFVYPALEYMDTTREWRTGVVRQGQGIDADALQNQSATAVAKVYNAAQAKMKLIARIMAETGFKQLFWKVHATVRKNQSVPATKRLRNKWVTVDPRQWKRRDDITISVGLGSGGKAEAAMFLMQVLGVQKEAIMLPGQTLVSPKNIYNTLEKLMETGGYRSVEPYFTDPEKAPPSEPPPDPKMVEAQGKLKIKEAETQAKAQSDQVKQQTDIQRERIKLQLEQERMVQQNALEIERMNREHALKIEQMNRESALREQQMYIEAQLEREGQRLNAAAKVATTPVKMGGAVG